MIEQNGKEDGNGNEKENGKEEQKPCFVYLLICSNGSTYIGATMDLERRLRQHNKEISGGAVATGRLVSQGETWQRAAYVSGFPDWQAALQFEWRWKQISRKLSMKQKPIERRLDALNVLLGLERPTSKAKAYCEWSNEPKVHLEIAEY
jgi:structure-specific endonuclease subunit SLX1